MLSTDDNDDTNDNDNDDDNDDDSERCGGGMKVRNGQFPGVAE